MQEHRDPQVAGAEIDGCEQRAQRCRKDTLHQHTEGSAGQQIGQVGRAKQQARQQTGFPDPRPAGAETLQQALGNDPAEDELLRHAHQRHAQKEAEDAERRLQLAILGHPEHQLGIQAVTDEHQRIHSHQQPIEKAAAPAAEQVHLTGAAQNDQRHHHAHRLLHSAEEVGVHPFQIHPKEHQCKHNEIGCQQQAAQKQHLG